MVACQWNISSPTGPAEQFAGGSFPKSTSSDVQISGQEDMLVSYIVDPTIQAFKLVSHRLTRCCLCKHSPLLILFSDMLALLLDTVGNSVLVLCGYDS